jgi:hypothetical protein
MEIVVIGPNYWGKGPDLKTAKDNFTRHGGRLSGGYRILTFDDETTFLGVNEMGYYSWRGNAPTEKDVAPRKRK